MSGLLGAVTTADSDLGGPMIALPKACVRRHRLLRVLVAFGTRPELIKLLPIFRFRDDDVTLQLHVLACNLVVFPAHAGLPEPMADWSLTRLQLKLIKIGARVVRLTPAPCRSSWLESPCVERWPVRSLTPSDGSERHRA